ncbi:MAG TPA: SOS response-associated peptidase family protein [Burkholderiaceae bacterium]
MCNNYRTFKDAENLQRKFGVPLPQGTWTPEVYPGYDAPIIRRPRDGEPGQREAVVARFSLLPWWAKSEKLMFATMNARTETITAAASYKGPVKHRQWCIVPAERFYEPYYAPGATKSERWAIRRVDGEPLGIAGLWECWKGKDDDAPEVVSFTLLTINADEHPLLRRFHKPLNPDGSPKEKRTVVLLRPEQFEGWLNTSAERAADFFGTFAADELVAEPAAAVPVRVKAVRGVEQRQQG